MVPNTGQQTVPWGSFRARVRFNFFDDLRDDDDDYYFQRIPATWAMIFQTFLTPTTLLGSSERCWKLVIPQREKIISKNTIWQVSWCHVDPPREFSNS